MRHHVSPLDPARGVTNRATRILICDTTFTVITQTLARNSSPNRWASGVSHPSPGPAATRGNREKNYPRLSERFCGDDCQVFDRPKSRAIERLKRPAFRAISRPSRGAVSCMIPRLTANPLDLVEHRSDLLFGRPPPTCTFARFRAQWHVCACRAASAPSCACCEPRSGRQDVCCRPTPQAVCPLQHREALLALRARRQTPRP